MPDYVLFLCALHLWLLHSAVNVKKRLIWNNTSYCIGLFQWPKYIRLWRRSLSLSPFSFCGSFNCYQWLALCEASSSFLFGEASGGVGHARFECVFGVCALTSLPLSCLSPETQCTPLSPPLLPLRSISTVWEQVCAASLRKSWSRRRGATVRPPGSFSCAFRPTFTSSRLPSAIDCLCRVPSRVRFSSTRIESSWSFASFPTPSFRAPWCDGRQPRNAFGPLPRRIRWCSVERIT